MVRLRNIREINNIIECDFIPEDSKVFGHMKVDRKTGKFVEVSYPPGYEWCTSYTFHAKQHLLSYNPGECPEKAMLMWY